ncbi:MAG: SusC/RagA family TonB-linked outer membrane protein [Draconibacterium sp.]
MRKILFVFALCFSFISMAYAQHAVTGTVIGDDGLGIPGVSIMEKGTTNGTITNVDGNYTVNVSSGNAVLVFSFVGMTTAEESVNNRTSINVTMKVDAIGLDEVVVTALGMKRDIKKIGYAVTEVAGEEIAAVNTVNTVQALQGKSAGLSINTSDGGLFGNSKIQIRGVSVLNSTNNQPIFVIDGVILDNDISNAHADWAGSSNDFGNQLKNLNPDDYESISVLKGAAATALYGSRGINGAIVIKTKDGQGKRGLGVKVSQSIGIEHVYGQPDLQYVYGPGALPGYTDYGDKDSNGSYYRFSTNQFYYNDEGVPTKQGHPWEWAGYGPKFDGRDIIDYDGTITSYSPSKNNMLDAYNLGFSSNTSVAISGGNEKSTFYLSDSYNYRTGVFPSNKFTRNSLMFSGTHELSAWLKAEASINLSTSNPQNPWNDLAEKFIDGTWVNWYDTEKWKHKEIYQAAHGGTPQSAYGDDYIYVPANSTWFAYNLNSSSRMEQVVRPIVSLTANVTDWFSVKVEGNMNSYNVSYEQKDLGDGYANDGGYYELKHEKDLSQTGKIIGNITKQLNDDFSTNIMFGGELWKQEKSYSRVRTDGGLIVPGRFFIDNSKKTILGEGKVNGTKQINSLYFLANFGWREQLFLDITGRNDWSSALVYSDGTGNYSYFYPSVSASWLFNETLNTPDWLSFGKLRLSWAQVGNDTAPYFLNPGYTIGNYELANGSFVYNNSKSTTSVDRDIKPEKKNSLEVGMDLRLFNNRLGFDLAYYNEKINNQIGKVPIPEESGVSNLLTNVGSLQNKGFEMKVNATPIKTKNFNWISTFNYWKNTTTVTELHEDFGAYKVLGDTYVNYGNYRIGSVAFEGGEYGILMSDILPKKYEAADPNDPRNGMNELVWSDSRRGAYFQRSYEVEEIGKIQPDFEGSWDNTFNFKNLTFSILLDARFGGYVASYANRYGTAYGWLETSLAGRDPEYGGLTWTSQYGDTSGRTYTDGVIPEGVFAVGQMVTAPNGQQVNVGGMTYQEAFDAGYVEPTHAGFYTYFTNSWGQGVINDNWYHELSYIAVRNISLGYNLPKSLAQRLKAQNLYVAINARNLGYLYNTMPNHMNPESLRGTSSDASFLQRSIIPNTATYTMTLSVDF